MTTNWEAFIPLKIQDSKVGDYWVSTIEVQSPYHYFETMVFDKRNEAVWEGRVGTLELALSQHDSVVAGLDNGSLSL